MKHMIIDGTTVEFENARNVLEVARQNGFDIPNLCYCENLYMEDCTMGEDANLAFEYSSINATLKGHVHSIKNPTTGKIVVESVGEIIIDKNQKAPANCIIEELKK